MPLGKYYCDYCDKEFQDTAAARRRHLQGAQHHRARALWYFHPKPHAVNPALAPSGPVPGAMGQQSNFLGTQPNFVGYPAVEGNSFSGDLLLA
uniref:Zinc finger CCCH domain-containing protein 3 n=1 Tax=Aegilops tauschii TaxID=37682 RepID=M8CDG0_AEGTA